MLSRRHLRVKVMQSLYAWFQSGETQLPLFEKSLISSIEDIYTLYINLLSALNETRDFALNRMEDARQKYLPTAEDLNPNTRFVDNPLLMQLDNNRQLRKLITQNKISWADHQEIIRKMYQTLRDSEEFQKYMNVPAVSYRQHKELVLYFFGEIMLRSDAFISLFEERSIHWADDIDTAATMVAKTIRKWEASYDEFTVLPPLLVSPDEEGDDLIKDFVLKLFRKVITKGAESSDLIAKRAQNWDIDRIASLDIIILKMALAEFTDFPSIPVKVTINEYIEISKDYSTPRSRQFVNGMLDKLVADLRSEEKIKKTGRGLIE
ncbi:MAG: transcription antitermination factor NusB [Lentimicrobiaceae bacterium]|nr:transcription antitermination factor NusB [Lentimicrobiaceae bacterium]MDD4598248.1 transcription antitermination factor NusB [Lentimicrobiaceae bacterium]MDY0027331.1 transcription antitermination factor NusB [Lentimicrobium sp.]